MERPLILRWKIMLLLVAVFAAGAILGSALQSTRQPRAIGPGPRSYVPTRMTPQLRHFCAKLGAKAEKTQNVGFVVQAIGSGCPLDAVAR